MAMKDQIKVVWMSNQAPDGSAAVHIEMYEGGLVSLATYLWPMVTLHRITPADARKIIEALTPLAQRVETADAAASEAVAR